MNTRLNGATTGVSRLGRCLMVLTLAWVAVGASTAWAEDEKLPSADQVIDKYIKATGGKAAYERHRNSEVDLSFEMPSAGMKMKMKIYEAAPNKQYVVMEGPMGKSQHGTDGKVAWAYSDVQGPMIIEGQDREDFLRDAIFNRELHWKETYKKIDVVGTATVKDKPCYEVTMTPESGKGGTYYFDKDSGLLLQVDMTRGTPMGEITVSSFFEDYKEVDGIRQAHKIVQKMPMMEQVITVEKIEYNVDMPKDRFDPPPPVQKKLDAMKKEKAGKKEEKGGD
jgi:hypothetical protein